MLRHTLRTALTVVVLGALVANANAFGHRWGCGGGYGGCGYGGCGYGGCGYGGCGYGGCGYGGYGYAGMGYGYGGYYGGYGGYGGWGYGGWGYAGPGNGKYIASSSPATPTVSGLPADSARLEVNVPAEAKVFVNDLATNSTGTKRAYFSTGLQQSRVYRFQLRVEFERDGKPVTEKQSVELMPGQSRSLVFGGPIPGGQIADTTMSAQR